MCAVISVRRMLLHLQYDTMFEHWLKYYSYQFGWKWIGRRSAARTKSKIRNALAGTHAYETTTVSATNEVCKACIEQEKKEEEEEKRVRICEPRPKRTRKRKK